MDATSRIESDRLAFIEQLLEHPERFDFYQALRTLEGLNPDAPPIGQAKRPGGEYYRLGQSPMLTFAPASLSGVEYSKKGKLRLMIRFFGLFGPQGPLPIHLTELAHERDLNFGDPTLRRFADIFHHRAISFFYMIWRQAQPTANRDRPADDRFMAYLGALVGQGGPTPSEGLSKAASTIAPQSKRYFAGQLGRLAKTPEGLAAILSEVFQVPCHVNNFHPHWMGIEPGDQTKLSGPTQFRSLGQGATLGRRVYDVQHSIEVRLGPMDLASYEGLLPGGRAMASLGDWLKTYLGAEWFVRSTHVLKSEEVPPLQLGQQGRLGWTTWLGSRKSVMPADELSFAL